MIAIIDHRMPASAMNKLTDLGFELMLMPSAGYLDTPVSAHPDMLIFNGWGKLFCHDRYFNDNSDLIEKIVNALGLDLTLSNEHTNENYPHDVLFNCVALGDNLLCNTKTVSRLILQEAQSRKVNVIHTNQGYTKCSVCRVSDNAVITADASIHKACAERGIDSLLVCADGVTLSGYDCGFIGGATGSDNENIYFCGDISLHPDGDKIIEFCKRHKKSVISLTDEELYDVGSIFFV